MYTCFIQLLFMCLLHPCQLFQLILVYFICLQEVLKTQVVSSHLAGMMASQELRIVVGALQLAEILMHKLPNVFTIHFIREGNYFV